MHVKVVGEQTCPEVQSKLVQHLCPALHPLQAPPQSMSDSLPSWRWSKHGLGMHACETLSQASLAQSVSCAHMVPSGPRGQLTQCPPSQFTITQAQHGTSPGRDAESALDAASPPDAGLAPETSTSGPETAAPQLYDGTTGKACATDADCKSANGPELARCSSSVFSPDDYYPTPVCILPSCATVSDVSGLHYCDGPDDPSSPGICIALSDSVGGTCIPKCSYDKAGDKATGCQGKDTCRAYSPAAEAGEGYCWAGCTEDSHCESGQHCQTDRGTCVAGVVPPTKALGQACTVADEDDAACRCF
jgi:hypothetical protein